MTPQLAQAPGSAALLGAIVRPLLVATILFGLWLALARAGIAFRRRWIVWTTVAAALVAWMTIVWTLAARGVLAQTPGASQFHSAGMIVVPSIALVIVALALVVRSSTITAAIDAAPLWWLISYQAYRIMGFIFVRLWWQGFLPTYFALPAGIGDTLTGALAIVAVVAFLRRWPAATSLGYAVNLFGIADLVNAITMGVLSTMSASNQVSPMLLYPLVIVPSFGVPLAFIIHALSIWQLGRRARVSSAVAVHGLEQMLETA